MPRRPSSGRRAAAAAAVLAAAAAVLLGAHALRSDGPAPRATRVARAATLHATPSTLGRVFATARGGDVIRLAAGRYGTFAGAAKPATVTLVADEHARATIALALHGAAHLRFEHLVITSALLARSHHVALVRNRFTGPVLIDTVTDDDEHILLAGNTHDDIDVCPKCYEGRITIKGHGNTAPNGVRIVDSRFSGGTADGVQVIGSAYGTQIGPGNRFVDMVQGDPDVAHTDPIQLYGSRHTRIVGNVLVSDTTGVMAPDGADHEVIEDNVIATTGYPWGIVLGADRGSRVSGNTLVGGPWLGGRTGGGLRLDAGNPGRPSVGTIVRDNVVGQLDVAPGSRPALVEHNLVAGAAGP